MMKRIVSIALVVLMIAALFAGCSGSSSPEGTYKIKSINGKDVKSYFKESMGALAGEGEEITDEQIDAILALMGINNIDEFVTFTLEEGGNFKASMMGEEQTGTWKLEGDKLTMTIDGDDATGTFKDGEITIEMEGESMVLAK